VTRLARGDDELFGGPARDVVKGRPGSDTVVGNLGSDTLLGGKDNDRLLGDNPAPGGPSEQSLCCSPGGRPLWRPAPPASSAKWLLTVSGNRHPRRRRAHRR
jgi:hypothetical protein